MYGTGCPFTSFLVHTGGSLIFYGELAGELEPDAAATSSAGSSVNEKKNVMGIYCAFR